MPLSADNLVEHSVASYVNGVSEQPDALRLESRVQSQVNCTARPQSGVRRRPGLRLRAELRNRLVQAPGPDQIDEEVPEDFWAVGIRDDRPVIRFASSAAGYRHQSFLDAGETSSVPGPHPHVVSEIPIIQPQLPEEFRAEVTERRSRVLMIAVGRFTADHTSILDSSHLYLLPWDAQDGVLGDFVGEAIREDFAGTTITTTRHPRRDTRVSLHGPAAFRNHYESEITPFHGAKYVTSLGIGVTVVDTTRSVFPDERDVTAPPDHTEEKFSDLPAASTFTEDRWAILGGHDAENPTNQGVGRWYALAPQNSNIWIEWSDRREEDGHDIRSLFGIGGVFQTGLIKAGHPDRGSWSLVVRWENIGLQTDPLLKYRREAGDRKTNPLSGITGSNLVDVLFLGNRAWILSQDGLQVSQTFRPYQWFATTMLSFPDNDPFFLQPAAGRSRLVAVSQLEGRVLVFGTSPGYVGEIVGSASGEFTARDSNAKTRGSWEIGPRGLVFSAGQEVYGVTEGPTNSGLWRFFFKDIELMGAVEESAHVPSFLPSNVLHISGSGVHRVLVLWSPDEPHKVFVFQWDIQQDIRTQAAWHEWDFGEDHEILGLDVVESDLWVLLEGPEHPGIPGEKRRFTATVDITARPLVSPQNSREVHLDKWYIAEPEYVAAQDRTILPWKSFADGVTGMADEAHHECRTPEDRRPPFYTAELGDGQEVLLAYKFAEAWGSEDGDEIDGVSVAAFGGDIAEGIPSVPGDQTTGRIMVGVEFGSEITLSQPFIREQREGSTVSVQEGSLSMKDYTLGLDKTRRARVEELRESDGVVVNFRDLVSEKNRLSIPLQGKNTDSRVRLKSVRGDHFTLVNGTWRGHFTSTARRV